MKAPEYYGEKWQDEDMTLIYPQFFGDSSPNIFNKNSVRNILQNLILDFLIPELESWTLNENSGMVTINIKPLELRLTGDDSNQDAAYDKIATNLLPVKNALEEQRRKKSEIPDDVFNTCDEIISSCTRKSELENLIINPLKN